MWKKWEKHDRQRIQNTKSSCKRIWRFLRWKTDSEILQPRFCFEKFWWIYFDWARNRAKQKTIVADVFKAAYFLQEKNTGTLVIVMTPKGESSFESYPNHVKPYFQWLKARTNLTEVLFIREKDYCPNGKSLEINGSEFKKKCTSLNDLCKKWSRD